ncbi:acyl-CoA N-acyltransferase [Basidiobolus meristosporus CBS 931.73]|uniref:Acyl-CoA N-acyltransferase n=1 Tax=Basidiobolus meristosporus CBS 931.73 TaxID=1314790 RepID=A0A1Y1Y5P4_9FUNG|nr:acyl-CoA N-acyltransferase [Basidiobolus meristosporus CBS 931.73]|eukprot:ORX93337.1 acyl-CoA N-acyltransferase [Basidiobolus meristosporus CBS 931.73]
MEVRTERCFIRPFKERDIDDFMVYRNDMDWMKYQGFKGLSKEEYRKELLPDHSLQDGRQLAIVSNKTDAVIGDIFLKQEEDSVFWIGYTIHPSSARQGYAYEAVLGVIEALKSKGATCVKAGVESENAASIQLLKKLDFHYIGFEEDEEVFMLSL